MQRCHGYIVASTNTDVKFKNAHTLGGPWADFACIASTSCRDVEIETQSRFKEAVGISRWTLRAAMGPVYIDVYTNIT
jgi:hypothetical protein